MGIKEFPTSQKGDFDSSNGASGVEAYVKANKGLLFPMKDGLIFIATPPLFLPQRDIESIEISREGALLKSFDLYVTMKS